MVPLQSACLYAIVASLGIVWAAILFMQFRLVGRFVRSQRLDSWNWYVRLLTHCVLSLGSFVFGILLLVPLLFTSGAHVASRVLFVDRSTGMSTGYSVLPP